MNYDIKHGDCLDLLAEIKDRSIDMILCDLPYGTTQNKWDCPIPLDKLWFEYNRIIKENGAIILTASQPFTSQLIVSNVKNFKFEWIWKKTIGSGQLNIKHQPLKMHESVLVFYDKKPCYNEQKTEGKPYKITRKAQSFVDGNYGKQKDHKKENEGFRHAQSVIEISNPRIKNGHPTQKPVELCEYFIKTYSHEGDLILDNCMGSGTTGVAAINLNRRFIGFEKEKTYFDISEKRIKEAIELSTKSGLDS
jgi:site-specific DNA-methyltransferase (adenine-specific)